MQGSPFAVPMYGKSEKMFSSLPISPQEGPSNMKTELAYELSSSLNDIRQNVGRFEQAVEDLRYAYGLPRLYAHEVNDLECLAHAVDRDMTPVKGVSHYQGRAHNSLRGAIWRVSNRFHRQKRPEMFFLVLMAVEFLLGNIINFRAQLSRLEAMLGLGPLAFVNPSAGLFNKASAELRQQADDLELALRCCETGEDVLNVLCGQVARRLAKPDEAVRRRLENFQQRAGKAGNGTLLFRLQNIEAELNSLCEAAAEADSMDKNAIGALAHRRFGIMTEVPGLFGLKDEALQAELNRKPRPNGGRKRKPSKKTA